MAQADYPPPTVICDTAGTGVQPSILYIGGSLTADLPPVIQLVITATATVVVNGSLQISTTDPPTLIDAVDVSNGGFTGSDFYDLIPGIPFYQINVTANTGRVIVKTGEGPMAPGHVGKVQIVRMSNVATQGM